jgi:hypothetical protein
MRFLRRIKEITRRDSKNRDSSIRIELPSYRRKERKWLGHIHRMKEERLPREIYETRVLGKNKISRPRLRWEDQVRQEAEQ